MSRGGGDGSAARAVALAAIVLLLAYVGIYAACRWAEVVTIVRFHGSTGEVVMVDADPDWIEVPFWPISTLEVALGGGQVIGF